MAAVTIGAGGAGGGGASAGGAVAGRRREIYRQVLAAQPENQGALLGLGLLAGQVERLDAAVEFFRKLAALCPGTVEVRCNLGEFCGGGGRKRRRWRRFGKRSV